MIKVYIILIVIFMNSYTFSQNFPFPQAVENINTIKPNNVIQDDMNKSVSSYYEWWKTRYLKESNGLTPAGGYYIEYRGNYNGVSFKSVSEAHGYGMIIFALMAGYDKEAKKYFDGMYNMYNHHRSSINNNLMSWIIPKSEEKSEDDDCATDGDMDIAYALVLADRQWGSDGEINYLSEAKRIILQGIKESLLDENYRLRLGDWTKDSKSYAYATRTSDWMPDHLKVYSYVTGDNDWNRAVDTIYSLISQLQSKYSPNTGLLSDFVVDKIAKPAEPYFLEDVTDGSYGYNACRDPWRLSVDYLHNNDQRAKQAVSMMIDFIINKTENDPSKILAGYNLDGSVVDGIDYEELSFTASFVCGAIVDSKYQDWLNAGWAYIKEKKTGYYGATVNLLSMLTISGNWWNPIDENYVSIKKDNSKIVKRETLNIYPNPFNPTATISVNQLSQNGTVNIYDVSGNLIKSYIVNKKGVNNIVFNAQKYASGVYFAKFISNGRVVITKKMILLK